jgi:hypothetical protein
MGKQFRVYLAGETVFMCKICGNHLAVAEAVLSKVSQLPLLYCLNADLQGIPRPTWSSYISPPRSQCILRRSCREGNENWKSYSQGCIVSSMSCCPRMEICESYLFRDEMTSWRSRIKLSSLIRNIKRGDISSRGKWLPNDLKGNVIGKLNHDLRRSLYLLDFDTSNQRTIACAGYSHHPSYPSCPHRPVPYDHTFPLYILVLSCCQL